MSIFLSLLNVRSDSLFWHCTELCTKLKFTGREGLKFESSCIFCSFLYQVKVISVNDPLDDLFHIYLNTLVVLYIDLVHNRHDHW